MIDEDIPCENILMQVNASKSAIHKVGHIIVEGHLENCIRNAIEVERKHRYEGHRNNPNHWAGWDEHQPHK